MTSGVLETPDATPERQRGGWRKQTARFVSLAASVALLVGLYRSMDVRLIGEALLRTNKLWLVISVGLILPITVLRALRFLWVAPAGALPGLGEALRLTLAASALNVFLPAKSGDLIKSYFVAKRSDTPTGVAIAIILYERLCDLFGLISWCLFGWLVARPQASVVPSAFWALLAGFGALCALLISSETAAAAFPVILSRALPHRKLQRLRDLASGWPDLLSRLRGRRRWIVGFSLMLWFSHLLQIWLFTVALSVHVPFTVCASLAAIALMAGQLPLTVAGLGTRDVALVVLLSPYMPKESAAAMGILIATRNFIPPLAGLPTMRPYLASVVWEARQWRTEMEQAK